MRRARPDVSELHLALCACAAVAGLALGPSMRRRLASVLAARHRATRPAFARRVRTLIGAAFGPLPPARRRALERRWAARWWDQSAQAMAFTLRNRLPTAGPLVGAEGLRAALDSRGALLVVPHFGPYVLVPGLLAAHGFAPRIVGQKLPFPWADRLVLGGYRRRGWLLESEAGPAALARRVGLALDARTLILASVDQAPAGHDNRARVPFLAGSIHVATGIFQLARARGAPVFAIALDARSDPLAGVVVPLDTTSVLDTARHAALVLAGQVARDPAGWNWSLPQLDAPLG